MTAKRFMIEKSSIVEDGFFICDNTGKFSFPTTRDKSELIMYVKHLNELNNENEQLKLQKPFLKIIDDYFIQYEDGEFFNLHKPSDIRSLMYILNREHGYSELQCEYNDLEKGDVE